MEANISMLGIMELRRALGQRINAAYFQGQPTVIVNGQKREPRAAIVPYTWFVQMCQDKGIAVPDREAA